MLFVYHDMLFFVVSEGSDNPWLNIVYSGLFDIPTLLVATFLVKYFRRKLLYLILHTASAIAAGAMLLTGDGKSSHAAAVRCCMLYVSSMYKTHKPIDGPLANKRWSL